MDSDNPLEMGKPVFGNEQPLDKWERLNTIREIAEKEEDKKALDELKNPGEGDNIDIEPLEIIKEDVLNVGKEEKNT